MNIQIGDSVLVTCERWFVAPDGNNYDSVFGIVHGIYNSEDALGIEVNDKSKDWYLEIGNMVIAGCQINYAIKTDVCSSAPQKRWTVHKGVRHYYQIDCPIYFADGNEEVIDE